jgi:hypothetical protein
VIELAVTDSQQKQYLGVYITKLPSKGKLYQYMGKGKRGLELGTGDGRELKREVGDRSDGPLIDHIYSAYSSIPPRYQFASGVVNVSSYWGGDVNYSPIQTFGPKNCFIYGDCLQSWSPLTSSGTGGLATGGGGGAGVDF